MYQNIGRVDRIIRLVAGVAIGLLGLAFNSWLGLLGLIPLLTAGVGVCPIYLPFGLSTRKAAEAVKR